MQRFRKWGPFPAIALIYSCCFGFIASALHSAFGFPLDDSYITETIARNLAETGVLGFHPGKLSPGETSLIWAYIQAANFKFLNLDPVIFNLVLSCLLLIVIGCLLFLICRRDGLSVRLSLGIAIAPAFCGNFLWLGLIGMEPLLVVALGLCSVYFWFEDGLRSAVIAGLAIGLLAVTRPDAIPVGIALLLTAPHVGRKRRELLVALSMWGFFVVIAITANLLISHSPMPGTLNGRGWLYFYFTGGPHSLASAVSFLMYWVTRPLMILSLSFIHPTVGDLIASLLLLSIALAGLVWIICRRSSRVMLLIAIAAAHFCAFLVLFPSSGQGGRYQPLNLLLLSPLMFVGLAWILRSVFRNKILAVIALSCAAGFAGEASLKVWRVISIDGIEHISDTHGQASEWLVANAPHSRVAVFDFGRISYDYKSTDIIDISGLTDPSVFPFMVHQIVPDYLRKHDAQFVVLPELQGDQISAALGFEDLPVPQARFCTSSEVWTPAWTYTSNAAQCQSIYQFK